MAKARSPSYPAIGLKEGLEKVKLVYAKDYTNKVPKTVIASHMGYKSLSGASLPILAALNQYGLLEGRGDETCVSDLALAIIVHEPGTSGDRLQALTEAAGRPELFSELDRKFPAGNASDAAVRAYLLTERFIPSAADTAIRSYRETKELVDAERRAYDERNPEAASQVEMDRQLQEAAESGRWNAGAAARRETAKPGLHAEAGMLKRTAVFNLPEGDVTLTYPAILSTESLNLLGHHLHLTVYSLHWAKEAAPVLYPPPETTNE